MDDRALIRQWQQSLDDLMELHRSMNASINARGQPDPLLERRITLAAQRVDQLYEALIALFPGATRY